MRWAWLALLAACDPGWQLTANVSDGDGVPIANAVLAFDNCAAQDGVAIDGQAVVTDARGSASVGDLGAAFPACDIVVAKAGFQPFASSFAILCDGDLDDCDPAQTIPVVLLTDP